MCIIVPRCVYVMNGGLAVCECELEDLHIMTVCVSHNGGYCSNEVPGCLDTYCSPPVSHFPLDRGVCNVCEFFDRRAQTTGPAPGVQSVM